MFCAWQRSLSRIRPRLLSVCFSEGLRIFAISHNISWLNWIIIHKFTITPGERIKSCKLGEFDNNTGWPMIPLTEFEFTGSNNLYFWSLNRKTEIWDMYSSSSWIKGILTFSSGSTWSMYPVWVCLSWSVHALYVLLFGSWPESKPANHAAAVQVYTGERLR